MTDPVVVFEILSNSTARADYGVKMGGYQALPFVQRYVLLQQTHRSAIVFARIEEGWDYRFLYGNAAVLDMPEIGIAVPLREIYEDIVLESDLAG